MANKKIDSLIKAHEMEIKSIKRQTRKSALTFFLDKTEHVMKIFKEQNAFISEAYYNLVKEGKRKDIKINRLNKVGE